MRRSPQSSWVLMLLSGAGTLARTLTAWQTQPGTSALSVARTEDIRVSGASCVQPPRGEQQ
eukprot:9587171-Alexandrium_andersonii.AAC.1